MSFIKLYATIFFSKDKAFKYILLYLYFVIKYIGSNITSEEEFNSDLKFSKVLLLLLLVFDGIIFFNESSFCKALFRYQIINKNSHPYFKLI